MARTQKHRHIGVGTPLGDDVLLLRSCSISESLGELFTFELDMLSEDHSISFDDIVGQNVTVRLTRPGGEERYFNGYVSEFSQDVQAGRMATYRATVVPWLWFLTRTADCRIFQEKKVPDIIKEVFRDYGFSDFDDRLTGSYRTWEYCVQYRETAFHFVSRLMEQEGIYYFFEHENGKHTLVLADSASAHQDCPDASEIEYRPAEQGLQDRECLFAWSIEKAVKPGTYKLNDFDFKNPKKNLLTQGQIQRSHGGASYEVFDHPGEYVEYGDGEQYARTRIEEQHAEHEVGIGGTNCGGIATGGTVTVKDFPRDDQNRKYLVTGTNISLSSDEFDSEEGTSIGGGQSCSISFTAIDAGEQYRAARTTPKPVIQGCQTAIVVGKAGEEIYTDEYGRVKVQFHWDRRSKADETSSCWIRVSQLWAGKKWGAMFIPRIGQEVIVEFLEGDPDRPIITGRVYNGDEMPPYKLPDKKTKSTIKTNSSKGGGGYNELRFEDEKGKEQIYVHAEKNQDVRVENDNMEWIGRDRHLIVKRHQYEMVEEDKHLKVKGDLNEKVDGTISTEAGQDWQQKTEMKWAHEAGLEIHLKSGMNFVIESAMQLTLKGSSSFITLGPAGIHIVGTPLTFINSGGSPGTGSGSSPEAPTEPKEADSDQAGKVDEAPPTKTPPTPAQYSSQATAMQYAAQSGTPFCEVCAEGGGGGGGGSSSSGGSPATQQAAGSDGGAPQAGDNAGGGGGGPATQRSAVPREQTGFERAQRGPQRGPQRPARGPRSDGPGSQSAPEQKTRPAEQQAMGREADEAGQAPGGRTGDSQSPGGRAESGGPGRPQRPARGPKSSAPGAQSAAEQKARPAEQQAMGGEDDPGGDAPASERAQSPEP